jgi:hypothetical protein
MQRYFSALLFLFGLAVWGQTKGARTFDLTLPENWKHASHLVLVFKDLKCLKTGAWFSGCFQPGRAASKASGAWR